MQFENQYKMYGFFNLFPDFLTYTLCFHLIHVFVLCSSDAYRSDELQDTCAFLWFWQYLRLRFLRFLVYYYCSGIEMLLKRKIYSKLLMWKTESDGRSALLIEGIRRCGKTTVVRAFAQEQYKSYILVDFAVAPKKIKDNFDNLHNLDIFYQNLSLEYGVRLEKRKSLIVFDEIQKFPRAREAVKYLVADGRYDIIETGSLISIKENVEDILIPSEEERISMYPLDFEEFLLAEGEDVLIDYIKECFLKKFPLKNEYHKRASRCFREYLLVGGMPQSVVAYIEGNKDFYLADRQKRNILRLYRDDISKADKKYKIRVSNIFENIPSFLSKHEKRVKLNQLGETADLYSDAFFWLSDAMLCNLCFRCNDPNVGLSLNKDESFVKCYLADTGLLVSMAFSERSLSSQALYRDIMNDRLSINEGMLFENMVAQMLVAKGLKLYFYTRYSEEKHRNDIEIDFLVSGESLDRQRLYPVEVKAGKSFKTVSLEKFREKFSRRTGESYVVSPKPFSKIECGYNIPHYMFFCLF